MSSFFDNLIRNEDALALILIFGGSALIVVVAIFASMIKRVSVNSEHEKSRREIAAYIAEGSMTPDDGVRLMNASPDKEA